MGYEEALKRDLVKSKSDNQTSDANREWAESQLEQYMREVRIGREEALEHLARMAPTLYLMLDDLNYDRQLAASIAVGRDKALNYKEWAEKQVRELMEDHNLERDVVINLFKEVSPTVYGWLTNG